MFTIDNAKRAAEGFAKDSLARGCLYSSMPNEFEHDDSLGDAETLSTIASLVVCDGVDGGHIDNPENLILRHLELRFPDFSEC